MNRSPRPDPTQPYAVAAHEIAKQELLRYMLRTPASERAMARAEEPHWPATRVCGASRDVLGYM